MSEIIIYILSFIIIYILSFIYYHLYIIIYILSFIYYHLYIIILFIIILFTKDTLEETPFMEWWRWTSSIPSRRGASGSSSLALNTVDLSLLFPSSPMLYSSLYPHLLSTLVRRGREETPVRGTHAEASVS